ncbi:MAG TPA: serine hydrolase domain-containing protein [Longimicrobiales bacterium]|nr:serine hydrolase domain-containing protein [Longimicrobiales bacterium]
MRRLSRSTTCALVASVLAVPGAVPAAAQDAGAAYEAQVDAIFAQWATPSSPGCAVGVYRNGAIALARGYGMADLERRVAITPQSVFDIGSTSKQFTAASILLLEQQGVLSLDDDVRRFIPELPSYDEPITIRHLLLHTSGLRDYIGLMELSGVDIDDVTTPQEALDIIVRQKELNFTPGAEHLYSNSGYFLLSLVVERASGLNLRDFARQQIFDPLGMTRTHYLGGYDDVVPDRALAYAERADGSLRTDVSRWLQLGDGAVFTTVEELLHWDENFYSGRVGGKAMLERIQETGTLNDGSALEYALGLFITEHRGQRTVAHGGAWGGYRAELLRFPDQHFSVAVLCNLGSTNPSALALRVADVYLAAVLAPIERDVATPPAGGSDERPVSDATPIADIEELAGVWRNAAARAAFTIVADTGKLYLIAGGGRYELQPQSATAFKVMDVPVELVLRFPPVPADQPRRMEWFLDANDAQVFEKLTIHVPSAAELAGYAGSFHSEELNATFTIRLEDSVLSLLRPGAGPQPLTPLTRDEFSVGSLTLRFMRDAGAIAGFQLDQGRARNIRFERVAR